MAFEKVEFNFPTEEKDDDLEIESSSAVELDAEIPIDVEIVDDTPEVDRNRTKSKPPSDVTDSELDQYSEKVANRIKHISKGYHDERREKEKVLRERGELESYTRNLMTENEKLRQNVGKSQATMFNQAKIAVGRDMEKAKADYKSAYEAGDADKLVEAQAKISAVTLRIDKLSQIKQPPLQGDENKVKQQQQQQQQQQQYEQQQQQQQYEQQQQQQAPQVDDRAKEWADENKWFGPNKQMTALALGFHNELVEDHGLNPTSDEYYEKIDSRMREVFPDSFEEASNNDDGQRTRKRTNVVASATRTTAPKKVKLTRSQVSIAKKLGVPLEDYAKQVANDMSRER